MTNESRIMDDAMGKIEDEWQRFLETAKEFSDPEMFLSGVVGHWSAKETLIHIAAWDEELVKIVQRYRSTGEESNYGDDEAVNRLNERQVDEKRSLSAVQVWDHLLDTHKNLVDYLSTLPDEAFESQSYTGDWIETDASGHYREHREDLELWKASR